MSNQVPGISRREMLQTLGTAGAGLALGCGRIGEPGRSSAGCDGRLLAEIAREVQRTPFVDTHEHLPDEADRLAGIGLPCDDWSLLFHDYLRSDLSAAGMPASEITAFFSKTVSPQRKWQIVEPFWPKVMNTGFGKVVRITMRELYGIETLDKETIPRLQEAYEDFRRPGMYKKVLVEASNIESCQVNTQGLPFHESRQPELLMQDLSFQNLHMDSQVDELSKIAGIEVRSLEGWHEVIRWWFDKYSKYAVAAKSQGAYLRRINYHRVDQEEADPVFAQVLRGESPEYSRIKLLQDHLFWFCVDQATRHQLPVKIHTGYLSGERLQDFRHITQHPHDIIELCRQAHETRFVFLHIAYPYWQDLIAVAKRFASAHIDMSWAWALDPAGATEFLKRYLVSAPQSKVFTFGGDYSVVECVLGYSVMARQGISRALAELVEEGWLQQQEAFDLVDPLLRGNARAAFHVEEKTRVLSAAPWI
jgi:predicted TIM-barrel fold metal-dependent hydrolase